MVLSHLAGIQLHKEQLSQGHIYIHIYMKSLDLLLFGDGALHALQITFQKRPIGTLSALVEIASFKVLISIKGVENRC